MPTPDKKGARGEAIVQAEDREVRVLFTNRALAEAESAMGKSVIGVAQGFADGASGISELAHLLRAGMEAARRDGREGGRALTLNDAYAVLDEAGFAAVAEPVMLAIANVLAYDPRQEEPDPNA